MKGTDGTPLKIIETVAAGDYMTFGMCLLRDWNEIISIKRDYGLDGTESITEAIVLKWLTIGGPTCTYQHLIYCLNRAGLGALAKLIADNRYRAQQ